HPAPDCADAQPSLRPVGHVALIDTGLDLDDIAVAGECGRLGDGSCVSVGRDTHAIGGSVEAYRPVPDAIPSRSRCTPLRSQALCKLGNRTSEPHCPKRCRVTMRPTEVPAAW